MSTKNAYIFCENSYKYTLKMRHKHVSVRERVRRMLPCEINILFLSLIISLVIPLGDCRGICVGFLGFVLFDLGLTAEKPLRETPNEGVNLLFSVSRKEKFQRSLC